MINTIVARATPAGRSGIGVIRLSGPDALRIAGKLVGESGFSPKPRAAVLRQLVDPAAGETIDEALITYFRGPHSFTGEDVVEISCHGSPVLLRQIIDICLAANARMAAPGEFSLRALANGRIDLAEAEAIRDLIDAQTMASARQAVRQMRGELSERLQPLKDDLLNVIVVLESAIEFVEDDLPETQTAKVIETLKSIADECHRLAGTFAAGHLIRDGLKVALAGRPNVGKSSLFNALLGSERAIVTDIAGTTRDQIHERLVINDVPISLIDTAGLRETADLVEKIGVERSRAVVADADLVIVIVDASDDITDDDLAILESVKDLTYLVAVNKIDKEPSKDIVRLTAGMSKHADIRANIVPISAKTGEGLDDLIAAILRPFADSNADTSGLLITDARHHDLLNRCTNEINDSVDSLRAGNSEEMVLVGLHNALRILGEITGETTTEDMLTRIFSTFCIGK